MYSKISFLFAIFGMALGATVVKPELANTNPFPHFETDEVFTCGGVIRQPSEQILYKPFRQVEANERCVWIVAVPNAQSFRVRLHHSGFEPASGHLNVAGVYQGWAGFPTDLINAELSSSWSSLQSSSALVITFHTSNETTTGFALEYEVVERGSSTSPNSEYSFVDADTLFIKYPQDRDSYDNREVTIFALPPLNNVEGHSRQVIYNRIGMEPGCYDKLSIYNFNSTANSYSLKGYICADIQEEVIRSTDASLLIFRSDSTIVNKGFNLAFTSCSA